MGDIGKITCDFTGDESLWSPGPLVVGGDAFSRVRFKVLWVICDDPRLLHLLVAVVLIERGGFLS